jgi:hypothetical protein
MKTAEAIHQGEVKDCATKLGFLAEDVNIPFALASVLQVSDDPAAILDRAMELRESKRARRLRRWFTELHERAISIDGKPDDLMRITRELDRQIGFWLDTAPRPENTAISLAFTAGIPSISVTRNLGFSSRDILQRRQLRFLYDLTRIAKATPKMHLFLGKVFGPEVGRSWLRGQKVLTHFTASPSAEEHRSLLDLR